MISRIAAFVALLLVVPVVSASAAEDDHRRVPDITVSESGGLQDDTLAVVEWAATQLGASWTVVHSGTLRLLGVDRGSDPVQQFAPGFGVPMSVVVYEVRRMGALLDGQVADSLEEPGALVMSERTAALRGAEVGDTVRLEGWNGAIVEVAVSAVVPDEDIGWSEIALAPQTALDLGLERPSRALLWDLQSIELAKLLLSGIDVRQSVRVTAAGEEVDRTDFTLTTIEQKERFGEFSFRYTRRGDFIQIDPAWVEANIVDVSFPETGPFRCHRAVVPYLRSAMSELRSAGLADTIVFEDFQAAGGCYVPRLMRGGDKGFALSRHAWGTAIDFNPSTNRYGGELTLPEGFGEVFRRWGFAWGAGWTVPDPMHFEWKQIPAEPDGHACAAIRISWSVTGGVTLELLDPYVAAC